MNSESNTPQHTPGPIVAVVDTWNPSPPKRWTMREHLQAVIDRKNARATTPAAQA